MSETTQAEQTAGVLAFPARVLLLDETRATPDELLTKARAGALDPSIFDEHPPMFWSSVISNNMLDAYSTRMMPSTLKNYATDAEAGVSFQDSHATDGLARTLGQSIGGRYTGPQGNGQARTVADFYTLTGMDPGIDAFVRKMRAGITRDNSVGFYLGPDSQVRCSICGRDMASDWDCWHWPGEEYELRDEEGHKTGARAVAEGQIENAHLAEVSAVYDGACPGAGYLEMKAVREIEAGRLKPAKVALLEQRYRMKLPHPARSFAGADLPTTREGTMPTDPIEGAPAPTAEEIATARLALTEVGAAPDAPLASSIRALVDEAKGLRTLTAEVERLKPFEDEAVRLRPLADEGRAYRADLVEQAITEGKRALGEAFAEETYRGLLTSVPIETVKRMRDDWQAIAAKTFVGGRATIEDHQPPNGAARTAEIPSAVFAG